MLYEEKEGATKAIELFNETDIEGRTIMVRLDQFAEKLIGSEEQN